MPGKGTYSAGTAFLTVVPSFRGVEDAMKEQVRQMAAKADKSVAAAMARGMKEAARESRGTGAKAGEDFAGAYNREARKRLIAAWRSLPEPQPGADMRKWDRRLAQVRADMKELSTQRIGFDIDEDTFNTAVDQFRRKLKELRDTAPASNTRGWFDADAAAEQLAGLDAFVEEAKRRGAEAGDGFGGAFNTRMQKVLKDGRAAIPPMKITADSTDAERRIAAVAERMSALSSARIGIDIDAATAYAELRAILFELQRLDRTSVDVEVRTNAHEAASGMAAFIQQAEQAGRSTEGIGQRANFTMSRLGYLIALGASLGTAIVPSALAAAAAVGAIGTSAIAGAAGLGVFALGVSGVADAVKALNGYEQDRLKSANSANQAQRRMVDSTEQVRMAQLALANTRRTIAEQAEDAARKVTDAEKALADSRRDAAERAVEAARRVADGERGVAEARRQAASDAVDAARAVRDAQRNVTRAEEDAREVRERLNEAIRDATRDMAELDVALGRNKVEQQKAVTAQMEALEELNRLKMNPRATEVELRRAQDAYDEQTQRLRELKQQQKELAEDQARATKLGVEGDERVIEARKRIAEADERVALAREKFDLAREDQQESAYRSAQRLADAQRQLADAQRDQARQQREGQEEIARANRAVADAQRDQARQQRDAQYQLLQATRAVDQAQRSQAQAWEKTGIAGGEALSTLNQKMDALSPAGQRFARFLFGLKDEVKGLRDAAAEPLLPRLEEAITKLLPYLPALEEFIGKVAGKMGDLAVAAVDALGNPVWQRFFAYVDDTAVPSLDQLFQMGMNTAEGLISLWMAMTPFNGPVGGGLVALTEDFARWARELNRSQGYRDFLDYVRDNGPKVVELLGETGELLVDLVQAAMPLGSLVLSGLTMFIDGLNSIPTWALTGLVFAIAAVSAAVMGLGAVMRVIKFRQQLIDIFGPRMAALVSTYAFETGRATQETSRFGRATATVAGMSTAAGTRIQGLGTAAFGANSRLGMLAATVGGPVRRGLDGARLAAFQAAIALNGPAGVAGAAQQVLNRTRELGSANGASGLDRLRMVAFNAALAMNGPGGAAAAAQMAGTRVKELGSAAMGTARGGLSALRSGAASLVGFMGGPWGVALAAGTVLIGGISAEMAQWNGKVQEFQSTLQDLGHTYHDLATEGKLGGTEARVAMEGIIQNNPDMARSVSILSDMGLGFDQMAKAAAGSRPDLDAVIATIDEAIDKAGDEWRDASNFLFTVFSDDAQQADKKLDMLRQLRQGYLDNADALDIQARAEKAALESSARYQAIQGFVANNTNATKLQIQQMSFAFDVNQQELEALTQVHKVFGDVQATGAQRADAMRAAIEAQTGSAIRATEADELFAQKLIALRDQVNGAKAAHDKHATSLDLNSSTALRNRDALEDAAKATRDLYLEDIASGMPMDQATKKHNDRIAALKEEAKKLDLTEAETADLIKKYGEIDPKVKTVYETEGFQKVYNELSRLKFMQDAVAKGWSVQKAEAAWKAQEWYKAGFQGPVYIPAKAEGGPIVGPGTGTSDDVLMWGSNGEFMQPTSTVNYYGVDFMEALRTRRIPKELLPGYATGGLIGGQQTKDGLPAYAKGGSVEWPFVFDVKNTPMLTLDEALSVIGGVGALGGGGGPGGWRWQMQVLRDQFPGLQLISGYRANSYTASGSLSWHSRDGGRAVDVPPRSDVFSFIHNTYGGKSKELIWGGNPDQNIYQGKHHRFNETLLRQHGPYKGDPGPSPHIHWAFDNGGQLMPGWNLVPNWTGQPEPVLSPSQWRTIEDFVVQGMAGGSGETHHWHFANQTLDHGRLEAWANQRDARARPGRPN